ncbi:MAG TPA: 2Fe-2S iron-sulfur cluster-binding protein, partial [Verrucomicrobiae bacterium]|nr:2Fe-2S iron-sulfur cluster-binding protein [Verrucomicrobiae bacterium]
MNFTLKIWRQKKADEPGRMVEYQATGIIPDMSFLEMLDVVNEGLIGKGEEPIAFDSDCREGICGTCSLVINGFAHGGQRGTT